MRIGYTCVSAFKQKIESQIEVLKDLDAEEILQEKFKGANVER